MLIFKYESGNDKVAVSERNIVPTIKKYIESYKEDKSNNEFIISQVALINQVGTEIFEGSIQHDEVIIRVEELEKDIAFDEEGVLTEFWYGLVPTTFY